MDRPFFFNRLDQIKIHGQGLFDILYRARYTPGKLAYCRACKKPANRSYTKLPTASFCQNCYTAMQEQALKLVREEGQQQPATTPKGKSKKP